MAAFPNQPDAHNNRGNLPKAAGRTNAVEACFRQAIEVQPKFAGLWNNLDNLLSNTGRTDEAIADLRKTSELAPDFARA
ncbi:MAG: tetratricopeptide repeat protein [Alphaproteobacteria bacterium]